MKLLFKIFLLSISLFLGFNASARSILSAPAEEDYIRRLELQPQLAERLRIPEGLSAEEKEALTFLFAYMPTPDILDHDLDFFLENTRLAIKSSEEMPWGKMVPDREWRHFVLPVRVNNEDLDNSRKFFYDELRPRLEGLSMEEAILEVNHWCHEKVSYQPSDQRTSPPLTTMANASGRCGEESTFAVAALRSVGIPARQVYTPRWAHTDDNHAWVEAWANGKWHFLGACEPEPVLDMAWFNAPASRGMLMTTKVIGDYDGPEEKLEVSPTLTIINITENYAPSALSSVYILGRDGKPIPNAKVRFCLYNYAELYPLVEKNSDSQGLAQFSSGLGDLVVWASDGTNFNLAKITAGDTLTLTLDKDSSFSGSIDFDLTPPRGHANLPEVSPEAVELNDRRKVYEDSLRLAYTNTFPSPSEANAISRELGLGDEGVERLMEARANLNVIEQFLRETPPAQRAKAVALLGELNEKDIHDVTEDVLREQLDFTYGDESSSLFNEFILNPRIDFEMLRPYKESIQKMLTSEEAEAFKNNPNLIADFIRSEIATDSLYNPESHYQAVTSTLDYKIGDYGNKDLAFVAICRALGVAARLDPVSRNAQYADKAGQWIDVTPSANATAKESSGAKSTLHIENLTDLKGRSQKYYSQFTISEICQGIPRLMEFGDFEPVESINDRKEQISPGQYFLLSGQRLADGTVLAHGEFFTAETGQPTEATLKLRQDSNALQVIGNLNAELLYTPIDFKDGKMEIGETRSILSSTGRGYYVLGVILPGHEPSAHALNDISASAKELEATERTLLILFPDKDAAARFRLSDYGALPSNLQFGIDTGSIAEELQEGLELTAPISADMPIFVIADSFNRIIFSQQGYTISLGETLARILTSLSDN